jgi:peptidoglycan/xylan/chitin deacetylase (PgdA/CDA1 family)
LLEGGTPLPHRSAIITFDDGWRDNYQYAWPILNKLAIPATIYLTVGLIETGDMVWFNKAIMIFKSGKPDSNRILNVVRSICKDPPPPDEFPRDIVGFVDMLKPYHIKLIREVVDRLFTESCLTERDDQNHRNVMNWSEISEMRLAGIEFGSHGMSHGILPLLTGEEIRWELRESKRLMEKNLGVSIDTFAYPNGDFDAAIATQVKEAGYRCGLATETNFKRADDDLFALPRIGIHTGASIGPKGNFSKSIFMLRISGIQTRLKGKR